MRPRHLLHTQTRRCTHISYTVIMTSVLRVLPVYMKRIAHVDHMKRWLTRALHVSLQFRSKAWNKSLIEQSTCRGKKKYDAAIKRPLKSDETLLLKYVCIIVYRFSKSELLYDKKKIIFMRKISQHFKVNQWFLCPVLLPW
jgi:hypothetical protein